MKALRFSLLLPLLLGCSAPRVQLPPLEAPPPEAPPPTVAPVPLPRVHIERLRVRATVEGQLATVEATLTLRNDGPAPAEARFRVPVPVGAAVDAPDLDVAGGLSTGVMAPAEAAEAVYTQIVRTTRDPALLRWMDDNTLELRVFPVPRQGKRQVRVRYHEVLPATRTGLRFVYGLPVSAEGPVVQALDFKLDQVGAPPQVIQRTRPTMVVLDLPLQAPNHRCTREMDGRWLCWAELPLPEVPPRADLPRSVRVDTSASLRGSEAQVRALVAALALRLPAETPLWVGDVTTATCTLGQPNCLTDRAFAGASALAPLLAGCDGPVVLISDGHVSHGERATDTLLGDPACAVIAVAVGPDPDLHRLNALARTGAVVPATSPEALARAPNTILQAATEAHWILSLGPPVYGLAGLPMGTWTRPAAPGTLDHFQAELPRPGGSRRVRLPAVWAAEGPDWPVLQAVVHQMELAEAAKTLPPTRLAARAVEAGLVTPWSSGVVLETAADYERLGTGPTPPPPEPPAPPADPRRVVVTEAQVRIIPQLVFAPGSAALQPEASAVLDEVAAILREHPELPIVRVEGHTDGREPASLGLARAEAVVWALFTRGVAPQRLELIGYGARRPLDPLRTAEARARNRRAGFKVMRPVDTDPPAQPALTALRPGLSKKGQLDRRLAALWSGPLTAQARFFDGNPALRAALPTRYTALVQATLEGTETGLDLEAAGLHFVAQDQPAERAAVLRRLLAEGRAWAVLDRTLAAGQPVDGAAIQAACTGAPSPTVPCARILARLGDPTSLALRTRRITERMAELAPRIRQVPPDLEAAAELAALDPEGEGLRIASEVVEQDPLDGRRPWVLAEALLDQPDLACRFAQDALRLNTPWSWRPIVRVPSCIGGSLGLIPGNPAYIFVFLPDGRGPAGAVTAWTEDTPVALRTLAADPWVFALDEAAGPVRVQTARPGRLIGRVGASYRGPAWTFEVAVDERGVGLPEARPTDPPPG